MPRHRRRAIRQRRAVHRDGAARRLRSGARRRHQAAADDDRGRVRVAGARRARGGAHRRHRAPRSQAGEPVRHAPARRWPVDQGARLRHRQGDGGDRCAAHARPGRDGLARVHVARAAAVAARRRPAHRYLGDRRDALSAAVGAHALSRADADRDRDPDRVGAARPARRAARAALDRVSLSRQDPGPALSGTSPRSPPRSCRSAALRRVGSRRPSVSSRIARCCSRRSPRRLLGSGTMPRPRRR